MTKTDKRMLLFFAAVLIVLAIATFAGRASAQDLVPRWQHSLFTPAFTVEKAPDGNWHTNGFTGAGYMLAWTVVDRNNVNMLGLGVTNVINMTSLDDKFVYTLGLNINFGGNFGVGAGYDLVNTQSQTGLAIGSSSWNDNGKLYLSFNLPFNGGGLVNIYQRQ